MNTTTRHRTRITLEIEWTDTPDGPSDPCCWSWAELLDLGDKDDVRVLSSYTVAIEEPNV